MTKHDTVFERKLEFQNPDLARDLFGPQEQNLNRIERLTGVDISSRGTSLALKSGDREGVDLTAELLAQLYGLLQSGHKLHPRDFDHALTALKADPGLDLRSLFCDTVFAVSPKKTVSPKSLNQREYLSAIRTSDLVFGIGPAGTGKTYLAVAMAVSALMQRKVKRLILTRPAVEAGERLGFLPGDMMEKVNPYLRPLYDALHDMLDFGKVQDMLETGVIEVAPLAFMRGRTLNDAFIILDEAQNTSPEQMKMFLTRMGNGTRAVVTGDITQNDLPPGRVSGLVESLGVIGDLAGVGLVRLEESDVVRHRLVQAIVRAYAKSEQARKRSRRGQEFEAPAVFAEPR